MEKEKYKDDCRMRLPNKLCVRVDEDEKIEPAKFIFKSVGPAVEHNYLCCACRIEKAVLNCNTGILNPCWKCQNRYVLIKKNWFDRLLNRKHA